MAFDEVIFDKVSISHLFQILYLVFLQTKIIKLQQIRLKCEMPYKLS